jgi:hypothetical protein
MEKKTGHWQVDTVLTVDIQGLAKRFGERMAVDAVDLRVNAVRCTGSSARTPPARRPC